MSGSIRRVLITGAASGLGWALAQAFAQAGDSLVLLDRNAALLAARVQALPAGARAVALDLTDSAAVTQWAADFCLREQRLDVLVNNAGITHRSPVVATRPEVLRHVMEVDYHAVVTLTLALYPALLAAQGAVVNIGSMAGWMPVMGRAAYCAAKGALHQFFETFRAEVAPAGVRVLMVYPSFLDTPIEQNALGADGRPARHARSTVGRIMPAKVMAARILQALARGDERLFPDRFSFWAALLYRLWPTRYHHLMQQRFAHEREA
ncbi:MAG: SDR family NAD(P)-dependent oxidoreductase [Moraxellaceae bacterium]